MTTQPLLSICIPTYNRASVLEKTLLSIVDAPLFRATNDVEIVISDNCSTDATRAVCTEFVNEFPHAIRYSCTEQNIGGDKNFYRVLSLAQGKCCKLNNDKCSFLPHTLATLLECIKENESEEDILFFPNNMSDVSETSFLCKDINTFVDRVSYNATWIGGFSLWRKDFATLSTIISATELHLLQAVFLYHTLAMGRAIRVYNIDLFSSLKTQDPIAYNPAKVFGTNYLGLLQTYCTQGKLSPMVYEKEKKRVLFKLIGRLCVQYRKNSILHWKDFIFYLFPLYKQYFYFYLWLPSSLIKTLFFLLFSPFESFYLHYKIILYRLMNNKEKASKYRLRLDEYKEGKNR